MTDDAFREIALSMPQAQEASHMGHPDFRVKNKIFATIFTGDDDRDDGMVKLTPEQQAQFIAAHPETFVPISGNWGLGGATQVRLAKADEPSVRRAIITAWRNIAPKSLVSKLNPVD